MKTIIKVQELVKSYGGHPVLNGVSFSVKEGEIFALLGANGAGKTTTLECMEGLRKYESGAIEVKGRCGVQLQSSSLPANMKACEALTLFSKWKHVQVDKNYLERIGVTPLLNKQYARLSTGQKRRLHLALALLGEPDIVVLDEPTAGLDVEGRDGLHEEIKRLKKLGKTIILSSHDMKEVEELCDRLAILKAGKIVFEGTGAKLTEHRKEEYVLKVRFFGNPDRESFAIGWEYEKEEDYFIFRTKSIEDTLASLLGLVKKKGIGICDIKVEQADIEQRFLEISREPAV